MKPYFILYKTPKGTRSDTVYAESYFHAQEVAIRQLNLERNDILKVKPR